MLKMSFMMVPVMAATKFERLGGIGAGHRNPANCCGGSRPDGIQQGIRMLQVRSFGLGLVLA